MSAYVAPLKDMEFVLDQIVHYDTVIATLPGLEDATRETVSAVLEEAAKFSASVLDPLNAVGDREGAKWQAGQVTTPTGWRAAYQQFVDGGWNGLPIEAEWGGQGLPYVLSALTQEMWQGTNMAFALCPLLTQGAIEALLLCGSPAQKELYLRKMVSGEWTGTMNLTEPQAGSDLAAVKTRAVPETDGSYRLFGQKIFITYGDHDLTENIVHLVLARTPTAPAGIKGISLFIVPKYLVNSDGSLGVRNDVHCVSIEHKLGIHASPTAILSYGDQGGAIGYLVGEENRGLEYMFIMMNQARFTVGIQGIGLSERSYQQARQYALERVQGRAVGMEGAAGPIIQHPDIRRMLLSMKAQTEAMRALALVTAAAMDIARRHKDEAVRAKQQAFAEFMIPIVKGWSTETAQQVTYDGIQIHGGMGYIEETGAAQYYRDARIVTIYEGTTAIQANDLLGRKLARDAGQTAIAILTEMYGTLEALKSYSDDHLVAIRSGFAQGFAALKEATEWYGANFKSNLRAAFAGSVPYLKLWGVVSGGWVMAKAAMAAQQQLQATQDGDSAFYQAKVLTSRFYADHILAQATGLKHQVVAGADATLALDAGAF